MHDQRAIARRDHDNALATPGKQLLRSRLPSGWLGWDPATMFLAMVLVFYVGPASVVSVPAGMRAVRYTPFDGTIQDVVWAEGVHFKAPWDSVSLYDIRVRELELSVPVRLDGREFEFDLRVQYRLAEDQLPELHERVGPNYEDVIVVDEVETALRELLDALELADVELLAARPIRMQAALGSALSDRAEGYIVVEDVVVDRVSSTPLAFEPRVRAAAPELVEQLESALERADSADGTRPVVIVVGEGQR